MNRRQVNDMDNMKQRRLEMGLTQKQLGERCGCKAAYMGMIERGDWRATEEMAQKIEAVLSGRRIVKKRTPEEQELHEIYCKRYGGVRPAYEMRTRMDRE